MVKAGIDNYAGCLLGGAIGDALGAPIEFMSLPSILAKYGENGVCNYVEFSDNIGRFTDDTQMTLFTAEGLLRYINRGIIRGIGGAYVQIVHNSYLRWLHTQHGWNSDKPSLSDNLEGWLLTNKLLFKRRSPGNTCLSALRSMKCGSIEYPINDSKGCGGVMRVAPVGLVFHDDPKEAFKISAELAAITHGHPSGYLSAGTFSAIISFINQGQKLESATEKSLKILRRQKNHEETLSAIRKALMFYGTTEPTYEIVQKIGDGWTGEKALAISLYCALSYSNDFEKAVNLSINHSGDSDSTGAITGNIVGLIVGKEGIPKHLIDNLESAEVVTEIAEDLYTECKSDFDNEDVDWCRKYPPH